MIARHYLARREFFGSLLFDSEENRYIPFDEKQTGFLLDGNFGPPVNRLEMQAFASFEAACRQRGVVDPSGHFLHAWANGRPGAGYLSAPLKLSLNVTSCCNIRCRHCYAYLHSGEKSEMNVAQAASLIDEMAALGIMQLSIKGGEPFFHAGLFDILGHAAVRNLCVTIITNGLLIDDEAARRMRDTTVAYLTVSAEGVDAATHDRVRGSGSFDGMQRAAAALKKHFGRSLYLYFTLNRLNLGQIPQMFEMGERMGCDGLRFRPILPLGRAAASVDLAISGAEYHEALRQIVEVSQRYPFLLDLPVSDVPPAEGESDLSRALYAFGCVAGNTFVHLDPQGNVYPCQYLESDDFLAGNVFKSSLSQIWHEAPVLREFRSLAANPTCTACSLLAHCRGGCRARAVLFDDGLRGPDPWCCHPGVLCSE